MHDAIEIEQRGIPAVAIHTTVFMNSADAHAKAFGRPDYQSVAVQHPISGRPVEEVQAKSDAIVAEVVCQLTGAISD
ncbi:MAG TPA: hypothetical protein VHL09_00340 [Dehalococcoidia bacterium]|nr:hypothetical protein [Dehalococcoidia bacterium]